MTMIFILTLVLVDNVREEYPAPSLSAPSVVQNSAFGFREHRYEIMPYMDPARCRVFQALSPVLLLLALSVQASEAPEVPAPVIPAVEVRTFSFALSVPDVEASARWYQRVFGFRLVRSVDLDDRGVHIRLLAQDGAFLELVQLAEARSLAAAAPGVDKRQNLHGVFKVGFRVDDLDAAVARLKALGVELALGVINEPDGSMRSAQVEDPDGNRIQLFEVLKE